MAKINLLPIAIFMICCPALLPQCRATNHALVIGVEQYKYWPSPSSLKKNIDEMIQFLRSDQKYHFVMHVVCNKDAVIEKITNTFKTLALKPGDNLFIYLTGHGNQIPDQNGDEKDGFDEAFVCYDTPLQTDAHYSDRLLIDDVLDQLITGVRRKIGPGGQIFMVVECCHSGTIERGKNLVSYEAYSRKWQSAFMSDASKNLKLLAPEIVFSSSRSSNETGTIFQYTNQFITVFANFKSGSYYDLFDAFYSLQRKSVFKNSDVQLTVNIDTEDPDDLRFGVFENKIYQAQYPTRVINIDPSYPVKPRVEIDKGIYEGWTLGTIVKLETAEHLSYTGLVDFVKSGSSWLTINSSSGLPDRNKLNNAKISVLKYNFQDTLFFSIATPIPQKLRDEITKTIDNLNFTRVVDYNKARYSFVNVENKGLFIVRNRDGKGLYKISDIKSAIVKLQISDLICSLSGKSDSSAILMAKDNNVVKGKTDLANLKTGDLLSIYVHPLKVVLPKYYCILQIEDEFVRQLVPVNYQYNESECKLTTELSTDIKVGDIIIGKVNGKLLFISSENPINLREVLLDPMSAKSKDSHSGLNTIELLAKMLFVNKDGKTVYDPLDISIQTLTYKVSN
jgi:hypothetical protein